MNAHQNADFLNRGCARTLLCGKEVDATWSFTKFSGMLMPFVFFQCQMQADGIVVFGYGSGRTDCSAVRKAFGEAWERICFQKSIPNNVSGGKAFNSNGFAAGRDLDHSLSAARSELVERAIVMRAWADKVGWRRGRCQSSRAKLILSMIRLKGWRATFFSVDSNLGSARVCLLRHSTKGAIFDSAFGDDLEMMDEKLTLSVAKSAFLPAPELVTQLPDSGSADLHWRFYRDPKNLSAFDFLDRELSNDSVDLGSESCIKTTVFSNDGVMPTVCVAENAAWPPLAWGREAIHGENKWPHPIA